MQGIGINYAVEAAPETLKLGPVLPYDTSAISCFELRNPMDQAIEVYSLDFDKQYIEEEEILRRIENFTATGSGEPLFLSLRKPGAEFWPSLRTQDEKKRALNDLKDKLKEVLAQLDEVKKGDLKLYEYQLALKAS